MHCKSVLIVGCTNDPFAVRKYTKVIAVKDFYIEILLLRDTFTGSTIIAALNLSPMKFACLGKKCVSSTSCCAVFS